MNLITLAAQFFVIACKGLWEWISGKKKAEDTNLEEQNILKAQRDNQIRTTDEADNFWDQFNGH